MAANWQIIEPFAVNQAITTVSAGTQNVELGMRVKARDFSSLGLGEGEFIYVKGCTNGAAGAWVTFEEDTWTTTALAANGIGPVGVMMAALDATSDFGWLQIYGKVSQAKCLTSFADNGRVFATASAGYVDDASVAGDRVNNAKGASTSTARKADFEIYYPFVNDATSAGG